MKNKEKYKDKILDIALQHNVVAVDKNNNSVEPCDEIPSCDYCLFQSDDEFNSCDDDKFIKWLEEESGNNTATATISPPIDPPFKEDGDDEDKLLFDKLEYDNSGCEVRWLYDLEDEEDGFLRIVENGYIARDMIRGELMFYCEEPTWENGRNLNKGYWFSACDNINLKNDSFDFIKEGECWAYNVNTQIDGNNEKIYNITKDLRENYV